MAPPGKARTDARILADLALAAKLPGRGWWRLARLPLDRWLPRPGHGFRGLSVEPGRWLDKHPLRFWDTRVRGELDRLREHPRPDTSAFTLIGRRRRLGHNSWLHGGHRSGASESAAWLRPEDLEALGVADGDPVEIRVGEHALRIEARAHEGLAPRTVVVPHGLPELNINALIAAGADRVERVSGQLTMTGIPADVVAAR
jgi:anaerobic selenocysteine-containing dehydrogenase